MSTRLRESGRRLSWNFYVGELQTAAGDGHGSGRHRSPAPPPLRAHCAFNGLVLWVRFGAPIGVCVPRAGTGRLFGVVSAVHVHAHQELEQIVDVHLAVRR